MDMLLMFLGALFAALAITCTVLANYIERAVDELGLSTRIKVAAVTARDGVAMFRYCAATSGIILACITLSACFWL